MITPPSRRRRGAAWGAYFSRHVAIPQYALSLELSIAIEDISLSTSTIVGPGQVLSPASGSACVTHVLEYPSTRVLVLVAEDGIWISYGAKIHIGLATGVLFLFEHSSINLVVL